MPSAISHLNFLHNQQEVTKSWPQGFFDAAANGPTSQLGDSLKSGTIWTHEFQDFTLPCGFLAERYIKKGEAATWNRQVNRRMEWLRKLRVMGRVRLHAGPDGLPGYHSMPLEDKAHILTDGEMKDMVRRALEDPANRL